MRLNTNWHPISYRLVVIADYIIQLLDEKRHFAFEPPLGDLDVTYAVLLRLIGCLLVDFLFVLMNFFRYRCYG